MEIKNFTITKRDGSNMVKCETMSEKSRYINIMETFVKLKSMIDNDKKEEKKDELNILDIQNTRNNK